MHEPELYHESNQLTLKDGILHLEEIKSTISWEKGEKILDVGCGPGTFTADILLKFVPEDATVVGCDISKKMVNFANARFKTPRLSFIEMDIESSNIWDSCPKESFSKIHSLFCFHFVENTTFKNIYSLLKPGGEIFVVFIADFKILNVFIDIRKMEPWKNFIKVKNYFTMYGTGTVEDRKKRITDEIIEAGFENVQIKVKDCTIMYDSLEDYLKVVRSVDPSRSYIPQHLIKLYEACFVDMVANKVAQVNPNDGKATINYRLFQIRSKKKVH